MQIVATDSNGTKRPLRTMLCGDDYDWDRDGIVVILHTANCLCQKNKENE